MKRGVSASDSNMLVIDSKRVKLKETQSKPAVLLTSKQRRRQAKSEKKRKTQVFENYFNSSKISKVMKQENNNGTIVNNYTAKIKVVTNYMLTNNSGCWLIRYLHVIGQHQKMT